MGQISGQKGGETMSNQVLTQKGKRLVSGLIEATKTGAGDFARGYRRGKPRGSVKVEPVGKYWGVFDYDPQPGVEYMTIEEGEKLGKSRFGSLDFHAGNY